MTADASLPLAGDREPWRPGMWRSRPQSGGAPKVAARCVRGAGRLLSTYAATLGVWMAATRNRRSHEHAPSHPAGTDRPA